MTIVLAATHHDPDGRIIDQTARVMPALHRLFEGVAVFLTPQTISEAERILTGGGATTRRGDAVMPVGHQHLGLWRRAALATAIERFPDASLYLFCDLDRALHWGEQFPEELPTAIEVAQAYDCLVFGRTARAFGTHPRAQRDTEGIANHAFALASGLPWDMMAAARGLSRRAAELIVEGCHDDTVGSDCSWPLFCRGAGLKLGYLETEGLEFETLDRCGHEIAALGGPQAWIERFDADPQQWAARLALAHAEVASAIAYR
jgi:hypothetical protein